MLVRLDDLGNAVKSLKEEKGLTTQELCKRSGLSDGTLYGIMSGRHVRIETVEMVVNAMDRELRVGIGSRIELLLVENGYLKWAERNMMLRSVKSIVDAALSFDDLEEE